MTSRMMRIHAPRIVYVNNAEIKRLAAWRNPDMEYHGGALATIRLDCRACWVASELPRHVVDAYHEATCPNCGMVYKNLFAIPDISTSWLSRPFISKAYLN